MIAFMDKQLIRLQNRCASFWSELKEERGESNFVAILLVILIAVAVAFVFKDKLIGLVGDVFDAIDIEGLSSSGEK